MVCKGYWACWQPRGGGRTFGSRLSYIFIAWSCAASNLRLVKSLIGSPLSVSTTCFNVSPQWYMHSALVDFGLFLARRNVMQHAPQILIGATVASSPSQSIDALGAVRVLIVHPSAQTPAPPWPTKTLRCSEFLGRLEDATLSASEFSSFSKFFLPDSLSSERKDNTFQRILTEIRETLGSKTLIF